MSERGDSAVLAQRGRQASRGDRWSELLVAAREGRTEAFDELLEAARPAIWRKARQRLQDDALADEVAARTFDQAWRNLHSYDPSRSNGSTWLYMIAESRIKDVMKARRGQLKREVIGFDSSAAGNGDEGDAPVRLEPEDDVELPPPEEIDQPLLSGLVRRALQGLSKADRDVLELFYFKQLSYEEIAEKLKVSALAVGPRLTRARQRLLEKLPPEAAP
jgi:RNA polymerase sigma-70 factor (ECF subfamily)